VVANPLIAEELVLNAEVRPRKRPPVIFGDLGGFALDPGEEGIVEEIAPGHIAGGEEVAVVVAQEG